MNEARPAGPQDAAELVRLRDVLLSAVHGEAPAPGPWREQARATLRERLAEPDGTFAAFVVDVPGGLAACAVGTIEHRLGAPDNPTGTTGHVFSVATDARHRRRGHARACMTGLLTWFELRGVRRIDLRATGEAEPLYRSLGFARSADPAMRLVLATR